VQASTSTKALPTAELQKKELERKNNAILYGLNEQKTAMEDITELMQNSLFKNYDKPLKAFRISQKDEGKIRPINLTFKDEQTKWSFLKRVNHHLRADKMFCKLDVNKEIRNREYQLREQMRKLKSENHGEYCIRDLSIEKFLGKLGENESCHNKRTLSFFMLTLDQQKEKPLKSLP